jgi:hypothetical protein
MANDHYMILWIEFLMRARRHVAHWNQLRAIDLGSFKLPGFANIEERERLSRIELALDFFGSDFVFHLSTSDHFALTQQKLHALNSLLEPMCEVYPETDQDH